MPQDKDLLPLDVLTIGRSSVDLYGEQFGGRLEDMTSFAKYVGGSPTNTAIGGARLGLRTGLLTKVGADHMGRFIREQLVREGVDVAGVLTDPERLTSLVLLGIRGESSFPLIFYRENCADMAMNADDVDPALIARSRSILINGTHLSKLNVAAASLRAITLAKANGARVIFDIDFRPVLWGLAAKDNGEDRFVADSAVTADLLRFLPMCDLVVGTEEEVHILGGSIDTLTALRRIRAETDALIVLKRGADGCVAYPYAIPDHLGGGVVGKGFSIEVFNVLGAGDAFMGGFLRGWLRDEDLATCCTWANACGALVVSRHGCAPAEPSWEELQLFLSRESWPLRLRDAQELEHIHWASNRTGSYPRLTVLAIDHRSQFDELVEGLPPAAAGRIPAFKSLALRALSRVAGDEPGYGFLADSRFGRVALESAAGLPYWIGRPIELPGSRPLRFEGGSDPAAILTSWPAGQVVKCLVFYHPDDGSKMQAEQNAQIVRLFEACRATRHELLLEVIASKHGAIGRDTISRVIDQIYDLGVYPDWWKLEPLPNAEAWAITDQTIRRRDPLCRGIVLLGLAANEDDLLNAFAAAAKGSSLVKGFAVGRTIWQRPAVRWLAGETGDEETVDELARNFAKLVAGWDRLNTSSRAAA